MVCPGAAHCEDDDDSQTDLLQTDQSGPDQQETEAVLDLLAAESKTKSKANAKWFSCWRATLVAAFVLGISTETCACSLGDVCTHVL